MLGPGSGNGRRVQEEKNPMGASSKPLSTTRYRFQLLDGGNLLAFIGLLAAGGAMMVAGDAPGKIERSCPEYPAKKALY